MTARSAHFNCFSLGAPDPTLGAGAIALILGPEGRSGLPFSHGPDDQCDFGHRLRGQNILHPGYIFHRPIIPPIEPRQGIHF